MSVRSFEENRSQGEAVERIPMFEETYPRYEFAPLVRLAMALGGWLGGLRRQVARRRADNSSPPALDQITAAE